MHEICLKMLEIYLKYVEMCLTYARGATQKQTMAARPGAIISAPGARCGRNADTAGHKTEPEFQHGWPQTRPAPAKNATRSQSNMNQNHIYIYIYICFEALYTSHHNAFWFKARNQHRQRSRQIERWPPQAIRTDATVAMICFFATSATPRGMILRFPSL